MPGSEVIDLYDDGHKKSRQASVAVRSASTHGVPGPKVASSSTSDADAASPADEAATFSGDEDVSEPAQTATQTATDENDEGWEALGYDFSGSVSADASQTTCRLCGQPLELSWDETRKEIVVRNAVMMEYRIYHVECANTRIPPCRSALRMPQGDVVYAGTGNGGEEA